MILNRKTNYLVTQMLSDTSFNVTKDVRQLDQNLC